MRTVLSPPSLVAAKDGVRKSIPNGETISTQQESSEKENASADRILESHRGGGVDGWTAHFSPFDIASKAYKLFCRKLKAVVNQQRRTKLATMSVTSISRRVCHAKKIENTIPPDDNSLRYGSDPGCVVGVSTRGRKPEYLSLYRKFFITFDGNGVFRRLHFVRFRYRRNFVRLYFHGHRTERSGSKAANSKV